MLRRLAASLMLLATAALPAFAEPGEQGDPGLKLVSAASIQERISRARRPGASAASDTTYVGFNPAYAGSNYWSIGVGGYRPLAGGNDSRRGYWDFDTQIHGDSLQGWLPNRRVYTTTAGMTIADNLRPWWAVDIGNQVNSVGKSGPANAYGQKRTEGVIGMWHSDPGNTMTSVIPGTTPVAPSWTPLSGSRSAWCGLRAHGDLTAFDPITGNWYNGATATSWTFNDVSTGGTDAKYPGYCGQWDQLLYRDITVPASGTVQVRFKYRSTMSTAVNTNSLTRTGWFDKDPLTVAAGNYVRNVGSTYPIDSFMVYVGRAVEPVPGTDNDWQGSDGLDHDLYDALRRWMAEVVHAFDGTHHELFTTFGNHATTTQTVTFDAATLAAQGYGGSARLVFRVKTNRGGGSDDQSGSLVSGGYSSGGAGAVILDDVEVDSGSGFVSLGTFEAPASPADSARTIDNDPAYSAAQRWKATGKPPATYFHAHDVASLIYQDLCGPVGSGTRLCNMTGVVVSMGDHDLSETMHGQYATAEQEISDAIDSPAINLVTDNTPGSTAANDMGLTYDMTNASEDFYMFYDMYTGAFDAFTEGTAWQFGFHSYPAMQSDGARCWGSVRYPSYQLFNPDKQCFTDWEGGRMNGLIRTSNASGIPDSVKIALRKIGQCFRFGISTLCGSTLGGYLDNFSFACVDGPTPPLVSVDMWHLIQDTFPANEDSGLPGLAAFDTCAALVKTGLNTAPQTNSLDRLDIAGDSTVVVADGSDVVVHMVFRVNPGPGNYVTAGDRSTGLRKVPTSPAPIASGDGSFWSSYILQNGDPAYPAAGGANLHGASGPFETRWNPLAWNAARMDTADVFAHPVEARFFNTSPVFGSYASTYHESDPRFGTLGILRNICFVNDTAASLSDITCGRANEPAWPPAWATLLPASRTGIPPGRQSREGTKIMPDGLFTPGTHVQYFFRREDPSHPVAMVPDTNVVLPQPSEGSTDGHRWQQFAVLPDTWKKIPYGGDGLACMLVVDWNDRRGDELAWVSIADSIGATRQDKWGAHNGWHASGGQDVNDPAARVYRNEQAGTTWDLYGVRASESLIASSGSLGSRLAHREGSPAARAYGKDAKNAPTLAMLEAYYRLMLVMTGDLNSSIFGPLSDKSSDDKGLIASWLLGASTSAHRGIWLIGDGLVESVAGDPWLNNFSVSLANGSYLLASGNSDACTDLSAFAPISTAGDVYGVRNSCLFTNDVLTPQAGGVADAAYGDPGGGPYFSSVYRTYSAPNYWESQVDGFDIENLANRFCDSSKNRYFYAANLLMNAFGSICPVVGGSPLDFLDVPPGDGGAFADLVTLRNNPLWSGDLGIALSLSRADRVTVRVYDVSGRLVRTLSDARLFKAGEHVLRWDGADDAGRRVARGVYFAKTRYESRGFEATGKAIVVK